MWSYVSAGRDEVALRDTGMGMGLRVTQRAISNNTCGEHVEVLEVILIPHYGLPTGTRMEVVLDWFLIYR